MQVNNKQQKYTVNMKTKNNFSFKYKTFAMQCCFSISLIEVHVWLKCCQGYGDGFDDVVIQGDLDELKFVAFYTK